jgi:hypothetical protein
MSKLTDGSENECADNEHSIDEDPFADSDNGFFTDDSCEIKRDPRLKRNLAEGTNLNNSFG